MTPHKQKAIEALIDSIEKYDNPIGEQFFTIYDCRICSIYKLKNYPSCKGCMFANKDGKHGCYEFKSIQNITALLGDSDEDYSEKCDIEFIADNIYLFRIVAVRLKLKVLPIIVSLLQERFTPSGWRFFRELDRGW
jgi:hypothetical protein